MHQLVQPPPDRPDNPTGRPIAGARLQARAGARPRCHAPELAELRAPTRFCLVTVAGVLLLCAGCQSSHRDIVSFLKAYEHEVSAIEYRVGIPDVVAISAPQILEIDGIRQAVRPDGKIALRLLGPVKIVGLTEKEIAAKLTRLLEPYYEDPKVQVRVASYRSKVIYLAGVIGTGGLGGHGGGGGSSSGEGWASVPYTGRDTVLDLLAGRNISFLAWWSQVQVIRSSPFEKDRRRIVIDVDHMMRTGDTSRNVLLQPNDILYIPPTPLGWLGLRVQEILFPFQPIIQGYTFPARVRDLNDEYDGDDD
jgi:protein involved in polysaccharide export with SLBB domain